MGSRFTSAVVDCISDDGMPSNMEVSDTVIGEDDDEVGGPASALDAGLSISDGADEDECGRENNDAMFFSASSSNSSGTSSTLQMANKQIAKCH